MRSGIPTARAPAVCSVAKDSFPAELFYEALSRGEITRTARLKRDAPVILWTRLESFGCLRRPAFQPSCSSSMAAGIGFSGAGKGHVRTPTKARPLTALRFMASGHGNCKNNTGKTQELSPGLLCSLGPRDGANQAVCTNGPSSGICVQAENGCLAEVRASLGLAVSGIPRFSCFVRQRDTHK